MTEFNGTLQRDDNNNEAFLILNNGRLLMQMDPTSTGIFDRQRVVAAWSHFSNIPNRSPIRVFGFSAIPSNSTVGVLFVVSA